MARTQQEAFDIVWQAFVVEGRPQSVGTRGRCFYRGPNGARCAVGLLMPDELYEARFDEVVTSAKMLPAHVQNACCSQDGRRGLVGILTAPLLLTALQRAHDTFIEGVSTGTFQEHMRSHLADVAWRFGLTVPGGAS